MTSDGIKPTDESPWASWPYDRAAIAEIVAMLHALAGLPPPDPATPLAPAMAAAYAAILEAADRCCTAVEQDHIDRQVRGPSTWSTRLRQLRANPSLWTTLLREREVREALRYGAFEAGIPTAAGSRWLHRLRDSLEDRDRAIDAALARKSWLVDLGGRPGEHARVRFVAALAPIYERLSGQPLRRSATSATHNADRQTGVAVGPGVRFVRVCLKPLAPHITDEAIAHLIRAATSDKGEEKRILPLDD